MDSDTLRVLYAAPISTFQAGVTEPDMDDILQIKYVEMDTASQMIWARFAQAGRQIQAQEVIAEPGQTEEQIFATETPWFAFMQVIHATPRQPFLQHHILVRVFAKHVDNALSPAVMIVQRKYVLYEHSLDRILFALQVSNAGFSMTSKKKVLVAACVDGVRDAMMLFTFDVERDFVFLSEFTNCTRCCDPPTPENSNAVHGHLDHAMCILYVFTNTRIFNVTLDSRLKHQQQEGYIPVSLAGGQNLPSFFQEHNRRIVQIASVSQVPFALYTQTFPPHNQSQFRQRTQNWQSFQIMTENQTTASIGVLHVLHGAQRADADVEMFAWNVNDVAVGVAKGPGSLVYASYFDSPQVLQEVVKQIQRRHDPGADASAGGTFKNMRMHGFSILNDRKRVQLPDTRQFTNQMHSVHMLVSHGQRQSDILEQEDDFMHDQVISLVTVAVSEIGIVTMTVHMLTIVAHDKSEAVHSFFYFLVPYDIDSSAPNNIVAKSLVAIMIQQGNVHTVRLTNFSCLQCGDDFYNATTESCNCRAGTLPVCLPCAGDCTTGRFIVDPDPEKCQKANMPLVIAAVGVAQRRQRYSLECMPCTGGFFCGNGTVNDVRKCPPERPLTLISTARADYQCVCPPGFAFETMFGGSYNVNGASVTRQMQPMDVNATVCTRCLPTELCSPKYTQASHRISCPPHTTSRIENVTAGDPRPEAWEAISESHLFEDRYHNVYQGCLCNAGYYRTNHKSESFLRDSVDFIYQYRWENDIIEEQSTAGNTRLHVSVEACRLCEAGFKCRNSVRYPCDFTSSSSRPGSTTCTCRPGYVLQTNLSCGPCPQNSICPGGSEAAVACGSSNDVLVRNDRNLFCPCRAGSILNAVSRTCVSCYANFFCPGFPNMTGVVPFQTMYARRCPLHSTSAPGSRSGQSCFCAKGFFVASSPSSAVCMPCDVGFYCPGIDGSRIACPPYTTTTLSSFPAVTISDCVCMEPNMQLLQASGDTFNTTACVCRAGWHEERCVRR